MSRAQRIANIIAKRHPKVEKLQTVLSNLVNLKSHLKELREKKNTIPSHVDNAALLGQLNGLDFERLLSVIETEEKETQKLIERFSRNTLNIGVVGRARQGKSRLLQSFTDLSPSEIPDGKLNNCTGVQSTIFHTLRINTYAYVYFHTEQSFLREAIHPFFDELQLGVKPISFDEFSGSLSPLPEQFRGNAIKEALYERLKKYHDNTQRYRNLLRAPSPLRIDKGQIREYVAQTDLNGQAVYFNFLAVREVKIYCSFPQEDIGQIALIDLPGLGDTTLGDEQKLKKAAEDDFDFVLFVYKPVDGIWQYEHVQLYETARSASTNVPIEKWSFLILNRTKPSADFADNLNYCQEAERLRLQKGIKVSQCLIEDCSDSDATTEVLNKVIDYLDHNIEKIDDEYLSQNKARRSRLQEAINQELVKARNALGVSKQSSAWYPIFLREFKKLRKSISVALLGLVSDLTGIRDEEDNDFRNAISSVLQHCKSDSGEISLDANDLIARKAIAEISSVEGGYAQGYYSCMHVLRTHLSRQFDSLDGVLKHSICGVKSQVAEILADPTIGRLGKLTEKRGYQFLTAISEQIPAHLSPTIKMGFESLASFDVSYKGLIKHRVRVHLDGLTPDRNLEIPFNETDIDEDKQRLILENLKELYDQAISDCEKAFGSLLTEPNQAAFAMAEDFVDQVLRSNNAEIEWQLFLEKVRSEIWIDEFDQLGERTRQSQEWLSLVDLASSANNLELV